MADRYEEKAREIHTPQMLRIAVAVATGDAEAVSDACVEINRVTAAALREQDRDRAILEARVTMLNEAHWELSGALRSASIIAEREGRDTNWAGFRETIRYSLEMSHLVINTIPAPPPDTGSAQIPSHETGGGDG